MQHKQFLAQATWKDLLKHLPKFDREIFTEKDFVSISILPKSLYEPTKQAFYQKSQQLANLSTDFNSVCFQTIVIVNCGFTENLVIIGPILCKLLRKMCFRALVTSLFLLNPYLIWTADISFDFQGTLVVITFKILEWSYLLG